MGEDDNLLHYKGYVGSVEISLPDNCLYGKILKTSSLITYEGDTVPELRTEFERSVDCFIEMKIKYNISN